MAIPRKCIEKYCYILKSDCSTKRFALLLVTVSLSSKYDIKEISKGISKICDKRFNVTGWSYTKSDYVTERF